MGNIGSIYDDVPGGEGRGPDLRATVKVPRAGLGAEDGVCVPLASSLPHEGEQVERAPQPGEPEDGVTLRLPADFPDGATLRLRGAGGRGAKGPGDLYLTVKVADDAVVLAPPQSLAVRESGGSTPILVAVGLAAAIALLYVLLG